MADPDPVATTTSAVDAVSKLVEALSAVRKGVADLASVAENLLGKKIASGVSAGFEAGVDATDSALEQLGEAMEEETGSSVINGLRGALEVGKGLFAGVVDGFQKALGMVKMSVGAGFDPNAMGSLVSQAGDFLGRHPVELTFVHGAEAIEGLMKQLPFQEMERRMMAFGKDVAPGLAQFAKSADDLGPAVGRSMELAADAMGRFGLSAQESQAAIRDLSARGIDVAGIFGQQFAVDIDVGDSTERLNGLQTAMLLARGSGLEMGRTAQIIGDAVRKFGYDAKGAAEVFGTLKQVQDGSRLSMADVSTTALGAADKLKFFGGNVETVASTYKNFIRIFGEGRQELAGDVFGSVIQGLASMNTNYRAFLGMTGATGGFGAGGAIGGALKVEKALETGEGLEGILRDLSNNIERFSGAQLMTREQAMTTGQEQQYFVQRQMVGQALGIQDPGQLNKIVEMLAAGGGQITTADITGRKEGMAANVVDIGRRQIAETMGPLEQSLNRIGSIRLEALHQMHDDFQNLSKSGTAFLTNFITPLREGLGDLAKIGGPLEISPEAAAALMTPDRSRIGGLEAADVVSRRSRDLESINTLGGLGADLLRQNTAGSFGRSEFGTLRPPTAVAAEITRVQQGRQLDFKFSTPPKLDVSITLRIDEQGMLNIEKYVKEQVIQLHPELTENLIDAQNNDLARPEY